MSLRHRLAFVVLTVLVGLPSTGTICAMACAPAASMAAPHHTSGTTCESSTKASARTDIISASAHDCATHDEAVRQAPTTAAARADAEATAAPSVVAEMSVTPDVPRDHGSLVDPTAPGPKPPKKTTPVLRV